jgi:hypothetical protein
MGEVSNVQYIGTMSSGIVQEFSSGLIAQQAIIRDRVPGTAQVSSDPSANFRNSLSPNGADQGNFNKVYQGAPALTLHHPLISVPYTCQERPRVDGWAPFLQLSIGNGEPVYVLQPDPTKSVGFGWGTGKPYDYRNRIPFEAHSSLEDLSIDWGLIGNFAEVVLGSFLLLVPEPTITKGAGVLMIANAVDKLQARLNQDKRWLQQALEFYYPDASPEDIELTIQIIDFAVDAPAMAQTGAGLYNCAKNFLKGRALIKVTPKSPQQLGKEGEKMSGITGPKIRIPSATGTAKFRVPDELTSVHLKDAKNVADLHWTDQLTDFGIFAQQNNLKYIIEVRQNTKIGPKAQQMIQTFNVQVNRVYPPQ